MSSHQALLIFHLLVVALGIGFSTSNFVNTRLAMGQGPDAQKGLGLQRLTIARIGDSVIALIWISGALLLWQRGMGGLPGVFHVKLLFVVLLTLLHGLGRALGGKMLREMDLTPLPRLSLFTGGVGLCAALALVCAVLAFEV